MTSTKPIEIMAPAKAARIRVAELVARPPVKNRIMAIHTVNLAPEDTPSTKGPAMGLWKKVCSR